MRLHLTADSLTLLALGPHQFVIQLEPQPKAGRGPEVAAQTQIVLTRARNPRPRSYGARRVRSCPKRLQAFAVFLACSGDDSFSCPSNGARESPSFARLPLARRPIHPRFRGAFLRRNSSAGLVRWFASWSSMESVIFTQETLPFSGMPATRQSPLPFTPSKNFAPLRVLCAFAVNSSSKSVFNVHWRAES